MRKTFSLCSHEITFDIQEFAKLSNSSILASMGDTSVLVTIVMGKEDESVSYFPLSVEYIERFYASGMISGSKYVKREGFPSVEATLRARMIDRSIRPMFPEDFKAPVQVIVTVLSYDELYDPVLVAINAISLGLTISNIPFTAPIAGLRAIKENDEIKISFNCVNIDSDEISNDYLNIVASTDGNGIVMIDADANEADNKDITRSFELITESAREFLQFQKDVAKEIGQEKITYKSTIPSKEIITEINNLYSKEISEIIDSTDKRSHDRAYNDLIEKANTDLSGKYSKDILGVCMEIIMKKIMKQRVLENGNRIGGRNFDEIRPLDIRINLFKRTHGSALFQRGGTQVISMATLASGRSAQLIESIEGEENKRYMHHYNAFPYCYGEQGRISYFPGRREIGHGALAEKALIPVIPPSNTFPYAIRVVSEVLMSEGSTSMASTCGSTLALMDAGVPIKKPVAGISVGLIAEEDYSKYQLLLDIAEGEDFYGKMDFKVAGTRDGVTAIQMDNKIRSIPVNILSEALELAFKGRLFVLDQMEKVISKPKDTVSEYAPKIQKININKEKIGELIGPGGKNIKKITEETNTDIDIEEDGTINIFGEKNEDIQKALQMVDEIAGDVEIGKIYEGTAVKLMPFGIFVEIKKGSTGLVHVSEISDAFVKDPGKLFKVGDKIKVKVISIDNEGKINLSIKKIEKEI